MDWNAIGEQNIKKQAMAFFSESFEIFYERSIATDEKGVVRWISPAYRQFLDLDASSVGKHITDIIPNSKLPRVIDQGEPIFLRLMFVKNQWVVTSVIPLKDDEGRVVGGFGFVASESVSQIKPLLTKYNQLQTQLRDARHKLEMERSSRYQLSQIVGHSEALQAVKKQIRRAARFDISVLLTGETGTGKELFAHALHDLSDRNANPFVSVNVAAIPDNLIEAEFFGVAPGAFTGASKTPRLGKFELADGGTLFLDEIGDMPLEVQSKLLRALQEQEIEPVGSNILKKIDVRIVAATSRNLLDMVADGRFRADLFYRLSSLPVHLPPLRERLADIELLCEKFMDEVVARLDLSAKELTPDALLLLKQHSWPGNIRELHNLVERVCILNESREISRQSLQRLITISPNRGVETLWNISNERVVRSAPMLNERSLSEQVDEAEKAAILVALEASNGRKVDAAKRLKISRASLYEKIKKHGL